MTWPTTRMGDHFRVKHGYAFKGEYFDSEGPYVLLTPGSFNEEGGYRDQGGKTKFYTGDVPEGYGMRRLRGRGEGAKALGRTFRPPSAMRTQSREHAGHRRLRRATMTP